MSCPRTQRSGASEARARDPSVSSQALYYWSTALYNAEWNNGYILVHVDRKNSRYLV